MMRKRGRLFYMLGLPVVLFLVVNAATFIWVKSIINDGGLDGRQSIMCISARDNAKYDMNNPPIEVIDWMLTSMLRLYDNKAPNNGLWHLRGFMIQSTLWLYWSEEERCILYRNARPSIRNCKL